MDVLGTLVDEGILGTRRRAGEQRTTAV